MDKKIVAVGDLHFPFADEQCLTKIYDIILKIQPDYIVQVGDLYDMFSKAKFPKTLNLTTPKDEILRGREAAETFWCNVHLACPNGKKYQLLGNHDVRPYKRLIEKAPELELFYDDSWLFDFDGVETQYNVREELELEGILFIHGWRNGLGDHARYFMCDVVTGHTHRGGCVYIPDIRRSGRPIFELNCGYAGNPLSVPFSYPAVKFTRWLQGVGVIDEHGPRFIPL